MHDEGVYAHARRDQTDQDDEDAAIRPDDDIGRRQIFVSKFELGERRLDAVEFLLVSRAIGVDPYKLMRSIEYG